MNLMFLAAFSSTDLMMHHPLFSIYKRCAVDSHIKSEKRFPALSQHGVRLALSLRLPAAAPKAEPPATPAPPPLRPPTAHPCLCLARRCRCTRSGRLGCLQRLLGGHIGVEVKLRMEECRRSLQQRGTVLVAALSFAAVAEAEPTQLKIADVLSACRCQELADVVVRLRVPP